MKKCGKIILMLIIITMVILALNITANATNDITSTLYTVDDTNKLITRVVPNTSVMNFKNKLTATGSIIVYADKTCTTEATTGKVKTGMAVKNGASTYAVSVLGDITGDGEVTVTDLNKIINYYLKLSINTSGDYELNNEYLAAANIAQGDSQITITDIDNIIETVTKGDIPEQCKPIENPNRTVDSIAIKTVPNKITYLVGERLDTAGLTVEVTYSDKTKEIKNGGFSWSPSTLKTAGTQTITVTYQNKVATFVVTVQENSETISVTDILLNKESTTLLKGNTETLEATVLPANASNKKVIWESSNSSAVTVNENGLITAIEETTEPVIIIATTEDGNFTDTCEVTVTDKIAVTGITLNNNTAQEFEGATIALMATILPEDATNKTVNWESSDEEIATVNENGIVTTIKASNTPVTITATTEDGEFKATCLVTVMKKINVTGITLNRPTTTIAKGANEKLLATILPENATEKNITWESSDNTIVSVDENGLITAIEISNTPIIITATTKDGNFSATCQVTVTAPVNVESISLDKKTFTIAKGDKNELIATVQPENATNKNIIWTSSNEEIVTVNNGMIEGISLGKATITAKAENNEEIKAECEVEVVTLVPTTGISLDKPTAEIAVRENIQLIATVLPEDATYKQVEWSTSNTAIATVNQEGNVTGVSAGTTEIRATTEDGIYATCNLTVVTVEVTSISIVESNITVEKWTTKQLTASIQPSNATDTEVTWSSKNPNIATINKDGVLEGIAIGIATITVETKDGSHKDSKYVYVTAPTYVTSISLKQNTAFTKEGNTMKMTATISPTNATNKTITWSSSEPEIATVDAEGTITALKPGTTVITAQANGANSTLKDTCTVTVQAIAKKISLDEVETTMAVGTQKVLIPTVEPNDAINKNIQWSSSDEKIAIVDTNGKITAKSIGQVQITAKIADDNSISATCNVVVTAFIPISSIGFENNNIEMENGTNKQLEAIIQPSNASNKNITWSSADNTTVEVSNMGMLTAKKIGGPIVITAITEDGGLVATCNVTVVPAIPVESVNIIEPSISLTEGQKQTLTIEVLPANATNKKVNWSTSATNIATVDASTGEVTAVATGTATITVTTEDEAEMDTCEVSVTQPVDVISITLNKSNLTLPVGNKEILEVTVNPNGATNKKITWTSNDTSKAIVDETTGEISAIAVGTATITAKSVNNKSATCTVTVIPAVQPTSIKLITNSIQMRKDTSMTFSATVLPNEATNKEIVWSTNAENILTVNPSTGNVTAIGEVGESANVIATIKGTEISDACTVTINKEVQDDILTLSESSITLSKGDSKTLTVTPEEIEIEWDTDNALIADVNDVGKVTAINVGSTIITATAKNSGISVKANVTVTEPISVESITLNSSSTSLRQGHTIRLTAAIQPSNAYNKNVTWESNNETIASVTQTGLVTANLAGNATITVTTEDGGYSANCAITVVNYIPVTAFYISDTQLTIAEEQSITIIPTILPSNASNNTVNWSSSNTEIATVDEDGKVTAVEASHEAVTITARTADGNITENCIVTVTEKIDVLNVSLDQENINNMTTGSSIDLVATITPENATNKTLVWTSSNNTIATVSNTGTVTAVKATTTPITITVTTQDQNKTASCNITIVDPALESTVYTIQEEKNFITRVLPGTTLENFISKFPNRTVKIFANEECLEEITTNSEIIKTGMALKYLEEVYLISVIGDTTGDGIVNVQDQIAIQMHINSNNLDEIHMESADVMKNKDICDINTTDVLLLQAIILDATVVADEYDPTAKKISSIDVKTPATKLNYLVGEEFNTAGLKIEVTYEDNTTATKETYFDCEPKTFIQLGTQNVTVHYKCQTVEFAVDVTNN